MNIKNKMCFVCASSLIDVNSNLLSVHNFIDEITITPPDKSLPELPPDGIFLGFQHELVSIWSRDIDLSENFSKKGVLRLFDPQNSELLNREVELIFQKDKPTLRFIVKFDGLKIKTLGKYRYQIKLEGKGGEIAEADFLVKVGIKK